MLKRQIIITSDDLLCAKVALEEAFKSEAALGGFLSHNFSTKASWCWSREDTISSPWYLKAYHSKYLYVIRYLFSLRLRFIRRPLRTGKVLGVTILSYINEPEQARLP